MNERTNGKVSNESIYKITDYIDEQQTIIILN